MDFYLSRREYDEEGWTNLRNLFNVNPNSLYFIKEVALGFGVYNSQGIRRYTFWNDEKLFKLERR